jgi:hypothetical protein
MFKLLKTAHLLGKSDVPALLPLPEFLQFIVHTGHTTKTRQRLIDFSNINQTSSIPSMTVTRLKGTLDRRHTQ